jgi:NAD(P)-dependent dehydrogenase (short-subunit alcohol dehydrogenase family)
MNQQLTRHNICIDQQGLVASFARAHPKALVLLARNVSQLDETAQEVRAIDASIEVLTVPTDVADEAAVAAAFDQVQNKFGTADVLVNNAGVGGAMGFIGDVDAEKWWNVMASPLPQSHLLLQPPHHKKPTPFISISFILRYHSFTLPLIILQGTGRSNGLLPSLPLSVSRLTARLRLLI